MTMYGANPEQLTNLGSTLNRQIDTISQVIPHHWANVAFQDLFVRGQGLADIMPSLLFLLGFTVTFMAVGLWRFDYNKA